VTGMLDRALQIELGVVALVMVFIVWSVLTLRRLLRDRETNRHLLKRLDKLERKYRELRVRVDELLEPDE
jgi:hypothetical protein